MEIDWNAAGGTLVYPYFQTYRDKIVVPPFEVTDSMGGWFTAGFDHGKVNPTAVGILWVAPDGTAYLVEEYYSPGHYLEHSGAIKRMQYFEKVNGEIWCDPSMYHATQQTAGGAFRSMVELYREDGIYMLCPPRVDRIVRAERLGALWHGGALDKAEPKFKIFSTCVNAIREFRGLRHEAWSGATGARHSLHEGIMKKDDHCIAAGTLVETDRGGVPIEEIKAGDRVLTRAGYRAVTKAWCSGRNVPVLALYTRDTPAAGEIRKALRATPNHEIFTGTEWVALERLWKDQSTSVYTLKFFFIKFSSREGASAKDALDTKGTIVFAFSVVPDGQSDVYDLSVEGEHEFFANRILVHNCWDALCYTMAANDFFDTSTSEEDPRSFSAFKRRMAQQESLKGDAGFFA